MLYQKFGTYILGFGFSRSKDNHYVYSKKPYNYFYYVILYVDDMLQNENNKDTIKDVSTQLSSKFDIKDLGAANFILSMKIKRV